MSQPISKETIDQVISNAPKLPNGQIAWTYGSDPDGPGTLWVVRDGQFVVVCEDVSYETACAGWKDFCINMIFGDGIDDFRVPTAE